MWTQENPCKHKVDRSRAKRGYPTDISDQEWSPEEPLLAGVAPTGRPRKAEFRAVINARRYLVQADCEWRMLPNGLSPYLTVYYWFRRLMRRMLLKTIHDMALMLDRMCIGHRVVPTAGVVDSQTAKVPGSSTVGTTPTRRSRCASGTTPSIPMAGCWR